jgi:hypothetical protein
MTLIKDKSISLMSNRFMTLALKCYLTVNLIELFLNGRRSHNFLDFLFMHDIMFSNINCFKAIAIIEHCSSHYLFDDFIFDITLLLKF